MNLFKLNLIAVGVVLLATAAFVWGLLLPGLDDLQDRQARIDREVAAVSAAQLAVGEVGDLYRSIRSLDEATSSFRKCLPAERKLGEFLSDLTQSLEASGISDYSIQPKPAFEVRSQDLPDGFKLVAGTIVLPVNIAFQTEFGNLCAFLARIESLERLSHVESIEVKNREQRFGWLKAEVNLHIYQYPIE